MLLGCGKVGDGMLIPLYNARANEYSQYDEIVGVPDSAFWCLAGHIVEGAGWLEAKSPLLRDQLYIALVAHLSTWFKSIQLSSLLETTGVSRT